MSSSPRPVLLARPPAPARPLGIEIAAAIALGEALYGIVTSLFATMGTGAIGAGTGDGPVITGSQIGVNVVLHLLGLVVALLIRDGRSWVICLNYTAVLAYLYVLGYPDMARVVFAAGQVVVVGVLYYHRRWFDAMRAWRALPPAPVADVGRPDDGEPIDDEAEEARFL